MGPSANTAGFGKKARDQRSRQAADWGSPRMTGDRKVKARECWPLPFRLNSVRRRVVKATAGLGGETVVPPKSQQKDKGRTRATQAAVPQCGVDAWCFCREASFFSVSQRYRVEGRLATALARRHLPCSPCPSLFASAHCQRTKSRKHCPGQGLTRSRTTAPSARLLPKPDPSRAPAL